MEPRVVSSGTATGLRGGRGTGTADPVPFPSVAWFERLADEMASQHAEFAHIGPVDCVMQVTILDGGDGAGPWRAQVRFDNLEVSEVRIVSEADEEEADFILETDLDTWREMVESIVAGGGVPDLGHTLNRLSLPGTPIRLWGVDPVRRDAYYRFNQSLQHYVNNCAAFETVFGERSR